MTASAPLRVCRLHQFDIRRESHGLWTARDRDGGACGTFITREAALRFALFEAGGDAAFVHESPARPCRRVSR